MNIGYVKVDKLGKFEYLAYNLMKKIRVENNIYYIPSAKEKVLKKLKEKLKEDKIDCVVQEPKIELEFNRPEGKIITKKLSIKILEKCLEILKIEKEEAEIYICVDNYSRENINIIERLCFELRNINLVTDHIRQFHELEKRLERNEIYIAVSNNKRKALKRAEIILNLDFENTKGYIFNRNSIIINANNKFNPSKDFDGICIEKAGVDTKKVLRIFGDMKDANKEELIIAELIKTNNWEEAEKYIEESKINITKLYGKRGVIEEEEFIQLIRKLKRAQKV